MKVDKILKDHNYESPDSTLKVKYVVNYGNDKTQKTIQLNPCLFKINSFTPKVNYKINYLRKQQFNSYSNENMDFFRLDHLSECDRNNYHNKFMDNIKPLNRSHNFQHFNKVANNIKYLDYLKQNYLLNQNKTINKNIYSEKDLEIAKKREDYYSNYPKILSYKDNIINLDHNKETIDNNSYNNEDIFNTINRSNSYRREISKSYSAANLTNDYTNRKVKNNYNNNNHEKLNIKQSYLNPYLSNINDYSIKEGDINLFEDSTKLKLYPTFQKEINNEKMKRLYNQERYKNLLNNVPFYIAYNENNKNLGFLKRNNDFLNYEEINKNKFFFRNNNSSINKNERNKKINYFNSPYNKK